MVNFTYSFENLEEFNAAYIADSTNSIFLTIVKKLEEIKSKIIAIDVIDNRYCIFIEAVDGYDIIGGDINEQDPKKDNKGKTEMNTLHRFTQGDDVDTGCGFMMCTFDPQKNFFYGDNHHTCDLTQSNVIAVTIDDFAQELFDLIKNEQPELLSIDYDADDAFDIFLNCLNPRDIVDSAEFWDCLQCVSFFWETIGDRKNIDVVLLTDGGIVFNKNLFITKKINHNEIGVFA